MHGVAEQQSLFNAALPQTFLHLGGDVDKRPAGGHLEPELLVVAFHTSSLFHFLFILIIWHKNKPGTTRVAPGFKGCLVYNMLSKLCFREAIFRPLFKKEGF
jgi:hypothetical protein